MKRKKLFGGVVLSAALVLSVFSGSAGAVSEEANKDKNSDKVRVLIQAEELSAKSVFAQKFGQRHDFGKLGFTTDVTKEQLKELQKASSLNVSLVETLSIAEYEKGKRSKVLAVPSDSTPWGIEAIYQDPSIQATSGGAGIRVAVLDTGVYTNHPDLSANVEQCYNFTSWWSPVVNGCNDGHGHGTHVAGSVLANGGNGSGIYGVAPEAKLWAYKVLSDSGSGYADDIAYAIRYAADQANSQGENVVISMSLGSATESSLISNAVEYATQNGALVVAAAGNSGPDPDTIGYPGGLKEAVGVAALENVQENGNYRVVYFSSRGNPDTAGDYVIQDRDVEVAAPGAAIESTWNNGGYRSISGTSMATPHISGLAAKIWATHPSWSNDQVRAELQQRAQANDIQGGDSAGAGDDIAAGFGFPTVQAGDN
ncbi:S8 family peptidase [Brevibacillus humidisoli]|uniref:S8 family peptidase n=1 Tax=Brevibacillus humidisoli TaxID=2895522 RepID=UPI001E3DF3FA|nr:S8 family peptidase [Brevibacillus humidisoli]UFJ42025.1 S8 family peptidase [Brevibacillus humidisoli]